MTVFADLPGANEQYDASVDVTDARTLLPLGTPAPTTCDALIEKAFDMRLFDVERRAGLPAEVAFPG